MSTFGWVRASIISSFVQTETLVITFPTLVFYKIWSLAIHRQTTWGFTLLHSTVQILVLEHKPLSLLIVLMSQGVSALKLEFRHPLPTSTLQTSLSLLTLSSLEKINWLLTVQPMGVTMELILFRNVRLVLRQTQLLRHSKCQHWQMWRTVLIVVEFMVTTRFSFWISQPSNRALQARMAIMAQLGVKALLTAPIIFSWQDLFSSKDIRFFLICMRSMA